MGCINSEGQFPHWFGNIHFSGPCNRACYFCIGQHMMALDPFNNLDRFPLPGFEQFVQSCREHGITEVNLTGSNTDPMLYRHQPALVAAIRESIPGAVVGIRTNGALVTAHPDLWALYDKASISITSFDRDIYRKTMGMGEPPDLAAIQAMRPDMDIKVNVVLCPETVAGGIWCDLFNTTGTLYRLGVKRVNLREPYGQPHVGNRIQELGFETPDDVQYGMPVYRVGNTEITYWDVHFVEVESVNLYANGVVSTTYPVTRGCDPKNGVVIPQSEFSTSGRVRPQWLGAVPA